MRISLRDCVVACLAVLPLVTAAVAFQAGTAKAAPAARPTVVVTVDLGKVFGSLTLKDDLVAGIKKKAEDADADMARRKKEVDDLKAKLNDLKGSASFDEAVEAAEQADMEYQAARAIAQHDLDNEQGLISQVLYRETKKAVAAMAVANGYDLVLVDDSTGEVVVDRRSQVPPAQQVLSQITGRRTLYVNPAIDITEQLIVRMNNEHTVSSGSAAPRGGTP